MTAQVKGLIGVAIAGILLLAGIWYAGNRRDGAALDSYAQASVAFSERRYAEAIRLAEAASAQESMRFSALVLIAESTYCQGDRAAAASAYAKALESASGRGMKELLQANMDKLAGKSPDASRLPQCQK